jgi:hypothetical protein
MLLETALRYRAVAGTTTRHWPRPRGSVTDQAVPETRTRDENVFHAAVDDARRCTWMRVPVGTLTVPDSRRVLLV